ncbi:MAG: rhodanese-related sulfurtransferase [Candidatus Daviesbacteria bacterium]|nr:rhodanese-related sulfurtransferase [Candidatus Daviesbacteria bacterium]
MKSNFQVLLYYKYIDLENPETVRDEQRKLCESLNLRGRIIVAKEGINGTLEGTLTNTVKYIDAMNRSKYFKDINFKKSAGTGQSFPKLSVKVRPEIIRLGIPDLNPNKISGKYISAKELHNWFETNKEFFIVDMRNDYEYESGFFTGSIFADIHNFFDLPKALPKLAHLKGKTIVTVCTGGVRCEKASGLLVQNGFSDVYQLKDGIQTYMEKYPNQNFKGKLYVFDNRLTLGFNTSDANHEIVGKCKHCQKSCDAYVNCAYDFCHLHYICCDNCKQSFSSSKLNFSSSKQSLRPSGLRDQEINLAFCKNECKQKYFQTIKLNSQSLNQSL